jgi:hypothetical protein
VLRFSHPLALLGAVALVATVGAQQPGVSLSPSVSFPRIGDAGPLAGLTLGVTDGPVGVRAGGQFSVREGTALPTTGTPLVTRPWSADADALLFFARSESPVTLRLAPYVFAGLGTASIDSGALRVQHQGWSYGTGAAVPVVSTLGAFIEARWRMSEFVLPNAVGAPPAEREIRLGLSFHVGGGGAGLASLAQALIEMAESYIGTPYRRGGTTPAGFDAWGFVRFVFGKVGVVLPSSQQSSGIGSRVRSDWRALAPGDVVLFDDERGVQHVAIYAGHSRIIHAEESVGVRLDDLNSDRGRWYHDHLAGALRISAPSQRSADDRAQRR